MFRQTHDFIRKSNGNRNIGFSFKIIRHSKYATLAIEILSLGRRWDHMRLKNTALQTKMFVFQARVQALSNC